jgi:hypothetical protein
MLAFVASRQFQVLDGSFGSFLYETVKENRPASPIDIEQHSRDPVLYQLRTHFIDAVANGSANGHSDGPAELYSLDVPANALPVIG